MFNTYTNSVLWPRGYKDYCSLLPERSERYEASRCCCVSSRSRCCCCYSSSYSVKPKVSLNAGFVVYGLRQSTLIQWPSFRRRLLTSVGVADGHCCDSSSRGFRIRAAGEFGRSCPDDVEAMVSFLSEEMVDEERSWKVVSRERYGGNVRRIKVEVRDTPVKKPQGFGRKEYKRNGITEDVRVEEKYDCQHCCGSRKRSSHQLESGSRRGSKLVSGDSVGKNYMRNEEREARPRRTKSSSCSSYYSLGSSGDFESDIEDQDEDVELHWEKLRSSEKKVGGQSSKGVNSRKEGSQIHLRGKRDKNNANGVGSSYRKQVFEEAENSNQGVTLNQRRRKQFNQTNNRVSESTGNYEEGMEIHEIHVNDAETSSQNQKYFGEREDNRAPSIRDDSGRVIIESSQQQLKERLGARYSSEEGVSEIHRRAKFGSSREEGINVLQKFPETKNDNQPLVEEKIFTQAGMKTRTERFSENSEIRDTLIRNTYVSQSNDQIRNQEAHAGLVSGLQSGGRQQDYHTEQIPVPTMQSDRASVSVSHSSDAVRYTEINRKSEKRLIGQGNTAVVELDSKNFGARKDSRLDHANSAKEGQKAFQLQSSQEKLSEEALSSQSYLNLVAHDRMQLVNLVSGKMQGSETTLIPPSSQLVSRGSGRSYGTGGVSIQEISHETSETGYPTAFENPGAGKFVSSQSAGEPMRFTTPEDALGSAHRQEQSSEKLIGEFVKKAKHDASTPGIEERRAESNQLTRQESRRASGGSGTKGPSDEMWVTDSAQGTPYPGTTEGNATNGNAIFKRNGRSLWGVIADIARLRWGTRAGSPDSSAKPIGKSSPNESSSSVTWFSGREHDGSSDDNANRDRPLPQEVASAPQLEISQTSPRRQIESSGATKLKQPSGRVEGIVSSPSSIIGESGSASHHMSSTTGDQIASMVEEESQDFEFRLPETDSTVVPMKLPSRNLLRSPAIKEPSDSSLTMVSSDQNFTVGEGRRSQARVPERDAVEKPLLFPGRSLRSPVVKEPSESHPTMVSGSSSIRQKQQPLSAKSQEETDAVEVIEGRRSQARVPERDAVEKQLVFPGRSLRSPVVKEPSESRPTMVSGSSSIRQNQQPLSAKSQEETGSPSTDSVLIQRKLKRNKQVVRDSFEEWEEAYRVEADRRTVDETFMREALVEAKKAADLWEVPVGAVLVHDGKIIARGYNLVEDLRDSTAHAEMICIREGSNVLRSWRLADTTLYVTLEPCPMCAGAILQARVNTLVWGAPNKLLGADGSWIRLFPGGEGHGSEVSEKPSPPVHPFHPKMTIRRGVLESECAQTMQQFFQLRRKKKDKDSDPPAPTGHHHHHPSKLLNKMQQILPFFCL